MIIYILTTYIIWNIISSITTHKNHKKVNRDVISDECTDVRPAGTFDHREERRLRLPAQSDHQTGVQYQGLHTLSGSQAAAGTGFPDRL